MKLSILIPARNEMFLQRTIEDILAHREDETEVIAVLDGQWADPPVVQDERVTVVKTGRVVGQRAATNIAAKLARGKYLMKVDAHCAFDQGFDRKMIEFNERIGEDVVSVPIMRNLWAFDWKCYACGWKKYQGPTPEKCGGCGKSGNIRRKMMWIGKHNPQSWSYSFDSEPHFQYFEDWKHRPGVKEQRDALGYTETMSLQGSCFMAPTRMYWDLRLSDEALGNWGNQGIELACKAWLSGSRVLVYHGTWYAHMFRTQGGDFGFPYHQGGREVDATKRRVWELFRDGKFHRQKRPVSWLLEKFWPVPGWTEEELKNLSKK